MVLDFGYTGATSGGDTGTSNTNGNGTPATDITTGNVVNEVNGTPATDINGISDSADVTKNKPVATPPNGVPFESGDNNKPDPNKPVEKSADKPAETTANKEDVELVTGSIIEVGDDSYTVNAAGDLVDKDGSVFKEAKDVKDWLATFETVKDGAEGALSIDTIQDVLGIEVTDENDKPITFENTPTGVKAYVEAVVEASRDDIREETINTLYHKYPIIPDILNYYVANGNSLEGFGEIQDRSGITIDDTNEAQHESIIRTAWKEQNRKGDVEGYIQYLKSSGTLLPTAKEELSGLQELDQQTKAEVAEQAELREQANLEKLETYWNGVKEVITNKNIAGYQIPDTIIINRGGQKLSATPNDFYNYVYQLDKDGKSAYEQQLAKEDPVSRRDDELLRAYLKFVGGNYSNLVGMAVNKEKVATLRLSAKTRGASSVKVTKPDANATKGGNLDLGFN